MSLLTDASLLLTPNAVKASKLYSVIPSNGNGDFTATRATTATRINSSGLVESVALDVPRLDYSLGGCPNILLEPQRTNLALQSSSFDSASWTKNALSVTANSTTSPSGVVDADTLTANGTLNLHATTQMVSVTSGTSYTTSIYAKKDTNNFIQLAFSALIFSTNSWANFDLNSGVVGSVGSAATATITSVGNGWYRCSITATATATAINSFVFTIITAATSARNEVNSLSTSVFLWGAQLEAGAYATSYIPTTTASVTRNADVISKTGISSLIGQTEGTLFAEIQVSKLIGAASRYIFHISDGTANNRIYMAFSGISSNVLRGRIFNGGTLQCSIDTSTITTTGTYKLALAYKNNDIVFYVNGVQIGVDTSATIPTCSRVDVGQNYANVLQLSDGIKSSALWKTRLTNSQLAALTA